MRPTPMTDTQQKAEAMEHGELTAFDDWIEELDVGVIQDEYGYERGEFAVYPEHWRPMWREGLSPSAAFKRALDAHADARREEEAARKANWERIQREDARALRTQDQGDQTNGS